MKKIIVFILLGSISLPGFAKVESLRGQVDINDASKKIDVKIVPKNSQLMLQSYVNQPVLIPHKVDTFKVNQLNNDCLQCHDSNKYRQSGATRVGATHYTNRDGTVLDKVAPRRYFCLQCHVTQTNAMPLIDNTFIGSGKFAN